jgi:hypothetical protein
MIKYQFSCYLPVSYLNMSYCNLFNVRFVMAVHLVAK